MIYRAELAIYIQLDFHRYPTLMTNIITMLIKYFVPSGEEGFYSFNFLEKGDNFMSQSQFVQQVELGLPLERKGEHNLLPTTVHSQVPLE